MPVRRVVCLAAVLAIVTAWPPAIYAQSPEPAAFEIGGTLNGFLVFNEDPTLYLTFGARHDPRDHSMGRAIRCRHADGGDARRPIRHASALLAGGIDVVWLWRSGRYVYPTG
jgi:hypothetical protein